MYCIHCGKEIDDGSSVCPFCDMPQTVFEDINEDTRVDTVAPKKPRPIVFVAAGVLAVAMVAVVLVVVLTTRHSEKKETPSVEPTTITGSISIDTAQNGGEAATSHTSDSVANTDVAVDNDAYNGNGTADSPSDANDSGSSVTLTVEASDGSVLSGQVRRGASGFVIADSLTREYSMAEIRALGLSDAELCVAWNEPFARQGYHFMNPGLRSYFMACDWYVDTGNPSGLDGAAAVNNQLLRQLAGESASASRWMSLATS